MDYLALLATAVPIALVVALLCATLVAEEWRCLRPPVERCGGGVSKPEKLQDGDGAGDRTGWPAVIRGRRE
ncbi:hypothetical protein [Streptomyces clavifer]|uniref:hypothetical protein n=1 Tax=Streptomyces clavifer TaxID=68188 RepID=UPI00382C042D